MRREVLVLIATTTLMASSAITGAYAFGGSAVASRALVAFAVCIPLGALSLELSLWSLTRSVTWQLGVILGGSLLRAGLALALGMTLYFLAPACRTWDFWLWMAAAYLSTLAIDVGLLFHALQISAASEKGASVPSAARGT